MGAPNKMRYLLSALLLTSFHLSITSAQQVGSFFTAIYLNGAPISSNQISCSGMGQPSYCCASGQSCAWDDGGKVACCASGSTCNGSPYVGAAAGAGQYENTWSPSSTWAPQQQTTTVYGGGGGCCQSCGQCGQTTNYGGVVPIVPVTVATVATPTSYYQVPTSTYYPPVTTTAAAVAGAAAGVAGSCAGGYTTVTAANVGAPVRTVGCNVIYDSGGVRGRGRGEWKGVEGWALGALGWGLGLVMI